MASQGMRKNPEPQPLYLASRLDMLFNPTGGIYTVELLRLVTEDATCSPERREYRYGPGEVPRVVSMMREAVESGSFSKEGPAWRATCRILGIGCTYKSIARWLRGELPVPENLT